MRFRTLVVAVALMGSATALAACGDDGGAAQPAAPAETSIPETSIPETSIPETSIPETAPSAPPSTVPVDTTLPEEVDTLIALEIVDGDLVGGSRQVDVALGDSVEVIVTGDSDDQVHVHGYDLYVELLDGEGSTTFDALIPGTFEIELEGSGRLLVRMTVS